VVESSKRNKGSSLYKFLMKLKEAEAIESIAEVRAEPGPVPNLDADPNQELKAAVSVIYDAYPVSSVSYP